MNHVYFVRFTKSAVSLQAYAVSSARFRRYVSL